MRDASLSALVHPLLARHGLELDDLQVTPVGKRKLVRISVDGDGPEGRGPLLDDITAASHDISRALDDSDLLGSQPFTLEVSSRGVSKPLTQPQHFRRNIGRILKVWLAEGTVEGRIVAADDRCVILEPDDRRLDYSAVVKAVVQVELNRPAPELDDVIDVDEEN